MKLIICQCLRSFIPFLLCGKLLQRWITTLTIISFAFRTQKTMIRQNVKNNWLKKQPQSRYPLILVLRLQWPTLLQNFLQWFYYYIQLRTIGHCTLIALLGKLNLETINIFIINKLYLNKYNNSTSKWYIKRQNYVQRCYIDLMCLRLRSLT